MGVFVNKVAPIEPTIKRLGAANGSAMASFLAAGIGAFAAGDTTWACSTPGERSRRSGELSTVREARRWKPRRRTTTRTPPPMSR
jgi:hypothetical protein